MTCLTFALCLGLLLAAGDFSAQEVAGQVATTTEGEAVATAPTSPQADLEPAVEDPRAQEVVCKTERVTGSLTRRNKTCMTRAEWDALSRNTGQDLDRYVSQGSGKVAPAANPAAPQ